jgi:SAM-dependent methyltransferase
MGGVDRRRDVPAHLRYLERAGEFRGLDLRERFARIFEVNLWGSSESVSGTGSALAQTRALRAQLPVLLHQLQVTTMLDLPCGDCGWMRAVDLGGIAYIGADIVPALVAGNRRAFGNASRRFEVLDLTRDPLPRIDLVLCRDCLVHLSNAHIRDAVENLRASGSTWLLATTFHSHEQNGDLDDGDWRPLNLERPPFGFAPPVAMVNEGCSEHGGAFADKSLGLWRIADLPVVRLD